MAAPKGNRFWEARSSHGPARLYKNTETLWLACVEYFEWVDENPLWENRVAQFRGDVIDMPVEKMRAMTVGGLCLFLDIDETTWREWRKPENDLSPIVAKVDQVIYQQKFTGAAADLLNPNIIARDLGLADKREITGKDGQPLVAITSQMTPQEAAAAYAATLNPET